MKQKRKLTRQDKKRLHGNAENYLHTKTEQRRKEKGRKLNNELNRYGGDIKEEIGG